ncbi:MAG: hypothetical protein QNJ53_25520 [Pleurocapsa sp. MO_192.B19]|nr:hypothetical protein [Pleurocapsa sp. MO_192.B19]
MTKQKSNHSTTNNTSEKTHLHLLNLKQLEGISGGPMAIIRKEG